MTMSRVFWHIPSPKSLSIVSGLEYHQLVLINNLIYQGSDCLESPKPCLQFSSAYTLVNSYKIETEKQNKANQRLTRIFPEQFSFCSNVNVCISEKGDHGRQRIFLTDRVEMGGQMVECWPWSPPNSSIPSNLLRHDHNGQIIWTLNCLNLDSFLTIWQ